MTEAPSPLTQVRREAQRAAYDRASIDAVLDAGLICHLALTDGDQPLAIPTLHARVGDIVYVHGSSGSRTLRRLGESPRACLTVTLFDGLVLARSVFEHSVNYRSVMLFGRLATVTDVAAKTQALRAFTEKLVPGRWDEARPPDRRELAATSVLRLPIDEASAKIRTGPPDDGDSPDAALPIWAGVLPSISTWGEPEPDPGLAPGIAVPPSVRRLHEQDLR